MRPIFLRRHRMPVLLRDYWPLILLGLLIGLVILPFGCANLAKPETVPQKLAYAEASLIGTYTTIRDLRMANRITPEQRDELVRQADVAGASLDAARAALAQGLPKDALAQLEAARSVLLVVQGLLQEHQK